MEIDSLTFAPDAPSTASLTESAVYLAGFTLGRVSCDILPLSLQFTSSDYDPEEQERTRNVRKSEAAR